MTAYLPSHLLVHFRPGPPLRFIEQVKAETHLRKYPGPMRGCAEFVNQFEDSKDTPPKTEAPDKAKRKEEKMKSLAEKHKTVLEEAKKAWDPYKDKEGDAFKTLFIGRLAYEVTDSKLRREFDSYGPIKNCHVVLDQKGKSRGYGFVEYEHETDMRDAFKYADGKKIEGKRVVVDVERGRTVQSWLPRRLGGGLGLTRRGAPPDCVKTSGRVDAYNDDRDRDRDRDRGDRRESRRSRSRERRGDRDRGRRRSRSRGRDRDRERERDRDRSRRERSRDRERRYRD
eukprot:m.44467 g.44467  ORF g.44467 m.44467 type:complete len:284 (+) comp10097_c0_seq1:158-1009(+)